MSYPVNDICLQVGELNITGDVVCPEWGQYIKHASGAPNFLAMMILANLIYWYRPVVKRDEGHNGIAEVCKKFRADLLQRGYADWQKMYGASHQQIRDAFICLEAAGVAKREFRTIVSGGITCANVLFISISPERIGAISSLKKSIPSSLSSHHPLALKPTPPSFQAKTYTETTPETTHIETLISPTSLDELPPKKKKREPSAEGRRLAAKLRHNIRNWIPTFRALDEKTLSTWALHIDKAIDLDGRTIEQIDEIIDWLPSCEFWRSNILSTQSLRAKFDTLMAKKLSTPGAYTHDKKYPQKQSTTRIKTMAEEIAEVKAREAAEQNQGMRPTF